MITAEITWDDHDLQVNFNGVADGLKNDVVVTLVNIADEIVLPRARARSITVWGTRSGRYLTSWYRRIVSSDTVRVGNDAMNERGQPYAAALEFGWTTRKGGFVSSPGVLFPIIRESLGDIAEAIRFWVSNLLRR